MDAAEYQQRETDYSNAKSSYDNAVANYNAAGDSATRNYWADKASYFNMQMMRAAYDIIRSDMADTVARPDLFKTWMEELNTYTTAEAMVDYYLQQGDYATALNKTDSLPYRFTFTAYDSIEYPMYRDFKHLQATWLSEGRTLFDLTADEINSLIAIADSSKGTAGAQARGILLFAYDTLYSYTPPCPQLPDSTLKSAELKGDAGTDKKNSGLTVSAKPNPANNTVTFSYTLPAGVDKAVLKIFNADSRLIHEHTLRGSEDKFIFNCSTLKQGVYYYSVYSQKEKVSGKLVIVH